MGGRRLKTDTKKAFVHEVSSQQRRRHIRLSKVLTRGDRGKHCSGARSSKGLQTDCQMKMARSSPLSCLIPAEDYFTICRHSHTVAPPQRGPSPPPRSQSIVCSMRPAGNARGQSARVAVKLVAIWCPLLGIDPLCQQCPQPRRSHTDNEG